MRVGPSVPNSNTVLIAASPPPRSHAGNMPGEFARWTDVALGAGDHDPRFVYSNLNPRPPGRLVSLAGLVVPGVSRVQRDVEPFAAAWGRANQAALEQSGPLWVALGDSLSQGIGASAFDRGWVGQVHERLQAAQTAERDLRVINLSVSGARTLDVLDTQLPALARLSADVAEPALVTLMIGSNDLMTLGITLGNRDPPARADGSDPAAAAAGCGRDDAAQSDSGRRPGQ
jgi:hypothetical protein